MEKQTGTKRRLILLGSAIAAALLFVFLLFAFGPSNLPDELRAKIYDFIEAASEVTVTVTDHPPKGSGKGFISARKAALTPEEKETLAAVFAPGALFKMDTLPVLYCNNPEYRVQCTAPDGSFVFFLSLQCNKVSLESGQVHKLPIEARQVLQKLFDGADWQTVE